MVGGTPQKCSRRVAARGGRMVIVIVTEVVVEMAIEMVIEMGHWL
jgi:mannose/fructose-specific phosphotransferase system component IIA